MVVQNQKIGKLVWHVQRQVIDDIIRQNKSTKTVSKVKEQQRKLKLLKFQKFNNCQGKPWMAFHGGLQFKELKPNSQDMACLSCMFIL